MSIITGLKETAIHRVDLQAQPGIPFDRSVAWAKSPRIGVGGVDCRLPVGRVCGLEGILTGGIVMTDAEKQLLREMPPMKFAQCGILAMAMREIVEMETQEDKREIKRLRAQICRMRERETGSQHRA